MNTLPPDQALWGFINLHTVSRCIHVIAEAGVADAIDDKPRPVGDLANAAGLNADALGRMLRLVSAHGVFANNPHGYEHTPASRLLRSDHPQSLRSFARMIGMPVVWGGFTDLAHAARTGRPAADSTAVFAYLADHPHEASLFNQAMTSKSAGVVPVMTDAHDFSGYRTIADIGGGRGHLLQAILQRVPGEGVLFDLPHVIAEVSDIASSRLRLMAGDFFQGPLPAADAYVLMEVIHDWNDDKAAQILAQVRKAAQPGARLLIIEALVSESPGPHFGKMLDIIMLAVTGGRERTQIEYTTLLDAAGFRLERVTPTRSQYSIIDALAV